MGSSPVWVPLPMGRIRTSSPCTSLPGQTPLRPCNSLSHSSVPPQAGTSFFTWDNGCRDVTTSRPISQDSTPALVRTLTWIAALVAATVAIALPIGYFALSYLHQAGAIQMEADVTA